MLAARIFSRNLRRVPYIDEAINAKKSGPTRKILGIETSFDETAAAVVDGSRRVLGEVTHSQKHNWLGGVAPWTARSFHEKNINNVITQAMDNSGLEFSDLDAIAVTTRPGMVNCLGIGTREALNLCRTHEKPLIKIHHMRAHALTARLVDPELEFPYLCLLMSGGHCLLCLVRGVEDFVILGQTLDDSPGELLDKVARRLRLRHFSPEFRNLSGGAAIEMLGSDDGNPRAFDFSPRMVRKLRNCNFSFSGLKKNILVTIGEIESDENIRGFGFISRLNDFCASVQHAVFRQTAKRVQRAMEILDAKGIIPIEDKDGNKKIPRNLVLSGGVAANKYIAAGLNFVAHHYNYRTVVPDPLLCTDNGVMIAWNGLETIDQYPESQDIIPAHQIPDTLWVDGKSPIGEDWTEQVHKMKWSIKKSFSINKFEYFRIVEPKKLPKHTESETEKFAAG